MHEVFMEISEFVRALSHNPEHHERLVYVHEESPRAAAYGVLDPPLAPPLQKALERQGIGQLYSHQAQAVAAERAGGHVGVVAATSSGKALC